METEISLPCSQALDTSLSWTKWIQSTLPHFFKIRFNIILPTMALYFVFLCHVIPPTLYMHLFYLPLRTTCPGHLILLDLITK